MATNRIRIGKQTELSINPNSVVVTDANKEQAYTSPGTDGQVFIIASGVPVWGDLNTWSNLANVMGAALTEVPLVTDTFTPRNGLHLAVSGTNNTPMWGGNLMKNTTINMIPQTGDGSPTTTGYTVLFDGQTSAPVGANTSFTVQQDLRTASPSNKLFF